MLLSGRPQEQVRAAAPGGVDVVLDSTGTLRVAVQETLSLTELVKAHELLEGRNRLGRVLLVP